MPTSLTLRGVKGTPLIHAELDANFTALRDTADAALPTTGGAIDANASTPALRVTQVGTGVSLLVEDSANPDSTPFIIDSSGRVSIGTTLVGASTPTYNGTNLNSFMVGGTLLGTSSTVVSNWGNTTTPAHLVFAKSRGGAVGTHGAVAITSEVGRLAFEASNGTSFIPAASITAALDATPGASSMPTRFVFATTSAGATATTERFRISSTGLSTFSFKFGYGTRTGVGGSQTQSTAKTDGVTLNTVTGQITTAADALDTATTVSFTLTNSEIEADDNIIVHRKSGGTAAAYQVWVDSVAAGSCVICIRNTTGGSLSEALVLQFSVVRGAIA